MPDKIFYSWQSDRPNTITRAFIEDALTKAIRNLGRPDDELYTPPRDLKLDKDTKGTPGSPPITDTIFRKIENCAVFVPDLTFCGMTDNKRPIPNANVLIEYGWALAKLGHERIVSVMNGAYGKPNETNVPFNIRHTRWPYAYHLPEDSCADKRNAAKQDLIRHFEQAIATALATSSPPSPSFKPLQPKFRVSSFLEDGDILGLLPLAPHGRPESTTITWCDGPQSFLRVLPHVPTGPYSPLEINRMLDNNPLSPFWSPRQYRRWTMGNEWGVVVFEAGSTNKVCADYIVQITRRGEIWGIDNYWLHSRRVADEAKVARELGFQDWHPQENVVRCFEHEFAWALSEYLQFSKTQLKLTSPVTVIAGFTGIQGFRTYIPPPELHMTPQNRVGCSARADIVSTISEVSLEPSEHSDLQLHETYDLNNDAYFRHAYEALIPFFLEAWNEFQYPRPAFLPKLNEPD